MNIPVEIVAVLFAAILSVQGWIVSRILSMEKQLTELTLRFDLHLKPERKSGDTDRSSGLPSTVMHTGIRLAQ